MFLLDVVGCFFFFFGGGGVECFFGCFKKMDVFLEDFGCLLFFLNIFRCCFFRCF